MWALLNQDYEISDAGEVRSLPRKVRYKHAVTGNWHSRTITPRVLSPSLTAAGYYSVRIGRDNVIQVHVAVLETFAGPRPPGFQGAHLDGNKTNNNLTNLQWVSKSENQRHRYGHGTRGLKLKRADVAMIFALRAAGLTQVGIGVCAGISQTHVSRILRRLSLTEWCP